jgi:NSS family neurotransmitter:Na+ symporter
LVLCYAAYQREREDTALNAFVLPVANNLISLAAGIMVLCTVFSVVPPMIEQAARNPDLLKGLGTLEEAVRNGEPFSAELMQRTIFSEGNSGITFIWMPQLFRSLAFGQFFLTIFFLALAVAAFTSLIAMVEVATRALVDSGFERRRAIVIVAVVGFLLGVPSALSLKILENQDWVWGVALMLSGLFFAVAVIRYGVTRFRAEYINHEYSDVKVGAWWDFVVRTLVPVEAAGLFFWLLYQAWQDDPTGWLHPFNPENVFNVGTVIFQLGIVLIALILFNRRLAKSIETP